MVKAITSWERENRTHFDKIVENYDKIRWSYPDELFADIIEIHIPTTERYRTIPERLCMKGLRKPY